jgi:co-chaperonin GroES (HSP10)
MKLINGNALVEIIKKEKVLSSGIIVPGDVILEDEGIVLEVDPNVAHIVNIGDRVKFKINNGHDIDYNGKKCKFLKVLDEKSMRTDIEFCYGKD